MRFPYLPNFYMGLVHTLGRDDDEALRYLLKAIEIDPSNPDPYLYSGQVLFRSEKTHEAIETLRESIALTKNPGRNNYQVSNAEYILGQILLKSGSRKEAVQHIAPRFRINWNGLPGGLHPARRSPVPPSAHCISPPPRFGHT